jgi:NADPH2:quinone reductase
MLRRKGTLVSVGNASGAVPPFAPLRLSQKNLKLVRPTYVIYLALATWFSFMIRLRMGNYTYTASEALYYSNKLWSLVESGTLKSIIHKEYPFTAEGVRQAQTDMKGGKTVGKLVIRVSQ